MFLSLNEKKIFSKYRPPSQVNTHSTKISKLTKNISAPRISSAINIQSMNSKLNLKKITNSNSCYNLFNNFNKKHDNEQKSFNSTSFLFFNKFPLSPQIRSKYRQNKLLLFSPQKSGEKKNDEESKKIISVMSEITKWEAKQLIEKNEAFKWAKIFCEKEKERLKIQKKYEESNKKYNENKLSNILLGEEKSKKIRELKFSVFDKNYDYKKFRKVVKKEDIIKDDIKEKLNNTVKKNYFLESQKEQYKQENLNLEKLKKIYKYVIENQMKKDKYKEVIESAYKILNGARKEYEISVGLLKGRINSLEKYYHAYIKSAKKLNKKDSNFININNESNNELNNQIMNEESIDRYKEYESMAGEISKEIKTYEDKYFSVKKDLDSFINEIKSKIKKINDEIIKFKYLYNELKSQQVEYYLDKLKKGNDTRAEGLSWIVKKLMELKENLKSNLFPEFLDNEQIKYIIQISKLGFESNQLKIILKKFKENKKDLIDSKQDAKTKNKNLNKKIREIENSIQLVENINFEINFNDCFKELIEEKGSINKKLTDLQEKFSRKEGISPIIKYKIENKKINSITQKIKDKINIYANTKDNKLFENKGKDRENLMQDLFEGEKEKKYMEDIIVLNDRITKLDDLIFKLKNEEYIIFEEKMKLIDNKEKISKNLYEKQYKALFGNTIFEISSNYDSNLSRYNY